MILKIVILLVSSVCVSSLFDSSDDVVELTAGNFDQRVINSDDLWLVEFYAPWCGHCRTLAPEWKKAATALKGIVKIGAVDMDVHGTVGAPYNVRGFPTIKVFGSNKKSPQDYNGARTAQGITDEAMKVVQRLVRDRLSGGGQSSGGGGGGGGGGSGNDVVELTDANFEDEVANSKTGVLVEFFAPWCGHCQRLEPEWKKAAGELRGKMKLAALDATIHTASAGRFQVQGYPTIKFFPAGASLDSAQDYNGGRTASDIVAWALEHHSKSIDPPEILELTSDSVLTANCNEKPLCVVSVLADILESGAAGRNAHLEMLAELGDKYKAKGWGWVWTAPGFHANLEKSLGIGGFGYPALAVVNVRKKVFVHLKGSFSKEGVDELLKSIAVGRGRTEKLTAALPTLSDAPQWDGKDGELPAEEDYDLSDFDMDAEGAEEKKDEL